MNLVLLIGVAVAVAFAVGGLTRRTVLGNRMDCSFEALKGVTPAHAAWDELAMVEAPVQADSIRAVRLDLSPTTSASDLPAELTPSPAPLHAQAS
jgi:hypothetical protein